MGNPYNKILGASIVALVVGVVIGMTAIGSSFDTVPTNQITAPTNGVVGVVGETQITCPENFTVKTRVGGTPDTLPVPICKAPNPSLETFECGDEFVDVNNKKFVIQCTVVGQ